MPQFNIPLFGLGLAASGDHLHAAGGATDDYVTQPRVYKLDLKTFNQKQIASMKYKRSCFGLLEMPSYDPNICSKCII